jgi:hypothetical protein
MPEQQETLGSIARFFMSLFGTSEPEEAIALFATIIVVLCVCLLIIAAIVLTEIASRFYSYRAIARQVDMSWDEQQNDNIVMRKVMDRRDKLREMGKDPEGMRKQLATSPQTKGNLQEINPRLTEDKMPGLIGSPQNFRLRKIKDEETSMAFKGMYGGHA